MLKDEYFIPSVYNSLRVLELLANNDYRDCTLSEVASALSINKSTCLRILKTLQKKEFLYFDERTKRYRLGSYLIALGNRSKEINNYISAAISCLPEICQDIHHTVGLAKQTDPYTLAYIAKEEPNETIRLTISTGQQFPIIGGAVGKSYLAFLPKDQIEQIVADLTTDGQLPSYTQNSITDPSEFMNSLKKIREEGIAETESEHTPGIHALACPIFNSKNEVILSLGIFIHSAISEQIDIDEMKKKLKMYGEFVSEKVSAYI